MCKARTNSFICSDCGKSIRKGDIIKFSRSDSGVVIDVLCFNCGIDIGVEESLDHPFSSDALGQL